MVEYQLPEAPIQKWADLRQAVEWIAYGLKPIPLAYNKALRGKIRSVQVGYPPEIVCAKQMLFVALLEKKIIAKGHNQVGDTNNVIDEDKQTFEEIRHELWDIDYIKWNLSQLLVSDNSSFINIKLKSQKLFELFPYPSLKKLQTFNSNNKLPSNDRPEFISSYIKLMGLAIIEFKISKTNQPSIKKLSAWFLKKLPHMEGEMYPSDNKANMLATLVREPEAQRGGNHKSP
jgi:hypothetical protein